MEKCDFPLDKDVINRLNGLASKMKKDDNDFQIFKYRKDIIDPLWRELIEKAIKCLRHCDSREPFKTSKDAKKPKAYGIVELQQYYNKYTEFEELLYGSSSHYRDHVVHVFRTWLLGVTLLIKDSGNGPCKYLDSLVIHEKGYVDDLTRREKLSMWTIIALTHDLGYPLQTAKKVIDTTRLMVSTFVSNPDISMDLSFHGIQNNMNDFIVKLMSSRMIKYKTEKRKIIRKNEAGEDVEEEKDIQLYAARLQPKYYFKFQKSLERNSHGVRGISPIIFLNILLSFADC